MKQMDYTREHDLTIEEIRSCPSFVHFTDQEAQEIIETLKIYTKIIFDFHQKTAKNMPKSQ